LHDAIYISTLVCAGQYIFAAFLRRRLIY